MKDKLLKIINYYGVMNQLKHFQSEVFELNEAIIKREAIAGYEAEHLNNHDKHITEEIADVLNMVEQFMYYYGINIEDVIEIKHYKIHRQLKRIENELNKK